MSVGCVRHSHEPSVAKCRDCHFDYCSECLIWPFGAKEPPLCRDCALVAAGVRGSHQRPRLVGPDPAAEPKRTKKTAASRAHAELYIVEPGPFRRWWARVLDGLITAFAALLLIWLGGWSFVATSIDETTGVETATANWLFVGGFWVAAFLYEGTFVYLFSGTPGKLLTGIRVVSPHTGGDIGLVRAFLRGGALLFTQAFGLLWLLSCLMVFVAPRRRTLHDYAAGSVVSFEID